MNPVAKRTHQFLGLLALTAISTLVLAACASAVQAEADPPEAAPLSNAQFTASAVDMDVLPPVTIAASLDWPAGLQPFAELPEVCQTLIANPGVYPAHANWRGCATCSQGVGADLGQARALYQQVGDADYIDAVAAAG
jgi:hypothetical protein